MRGDIADTKEALKAVLAGQSYLDAVSAVIAEKSLKILDVPNPFALRAPAVFLEETLTRNLFPFCELLAYQTVYLDDEDTMVKMAKHRIGIRWTALEKNERAATLSAEILCTATVELLWNPFMASLLSDTGLNAGPVVIVEEDFSPLLPDPNKAFMKGGVVIVEITTYRS